MEQEEIVTYFSTLRYLLNERRETREIRWLELYNQIQQEDIEQIGVLLALVHPHNYEERLRKAVLNKELRTYFVKNRFDESTLQLTSKCSIGNILGIDGLECPYIRQIQQDHFWPYSLGGPTVKENRIHLCQECNGAKSNSPFLFKSEETPRWLKKKLELIWLLFTR